LEIVAGNPDVARRHGPGQVILVGAGPGDPDLLTLAAVKALGEADVILTDDLVSDAVLAFAKAEARVILVGKRGGRPSCRQDEVSALIVALASKGRVVVRLKGGDPSIFGRAAEEIDAARAAGIKVRVVPGITSAQGAAASLGLSLTRRVEARRVQFVTGHDVDGKLPAEMTGRALSDPTTTTIVYMPRGTLAGLLARAIEGGLPPETPALAVFSATRPDEEVVRGTAATLADTVAANGHDGPCLVMIGRAMRAEAVAGAEPALTPERVRALPSAGS
jgi:uroporphyrin-III C-methyltransferase/precorrin-2 dehydrogenase/sirohydrochlorin ferrochelatase